MSFPPLTSIKFQEKPPVLELPRNLWRYAYNLAVGALSLMQNVGEVFAWIVAINTLPVSGRQNPGHCVLGKTEINMVRERSLYVTTCVSQPWHSCVAKCELIRKSRFWYLG